MISVEGELFYDVELMSVAPTGSLVFANAHQRFELSSRFPQWWSAGQIGCLVIAEDRKDWGFYIYPDPRLRRAPELDNPDRRLWGWKLCDRKILIKDGVTPGKNGAFIKEDTTPLSIEIPRELVDLCLQSGVLPTELLRGFIADLCELMNYCARPREDGYCSNGSDERLYARRYFERAHGVPMMQESPNKR